MNPKGGPRPSPLDEPSVPNTSEAKNVDFMFSALLTKCSRWRSLEVYLTESLKTVEATTLTYARGT